MQSTRQIAWCGAHPRPVAPRFASSMSDRSLTTSSRGARDPVLTTGRNLATQALGDAVNQEGELWRERGDLPLDHTRAEGALQKSRYGPVVDRPATGRSPRMQGGMWSPRTSAPRVTATIASRA